jgi:hypothetical protein
MSDDDGWNARWERVNWYSNLDDAGRQAVKAKVKATRDANRAIAAASVRRPALWERLEPPYTVARAQRTWDRAQVARRMRAADFTLAEIGKRIGCGKAQVEVTLRRFEFHQPRAPIVKWLESWERTRGERAFLAKAEEERYVAVETRQRLAKAAQPTQPTQPKPPKPAARRVSQPRAILDIEPSEAGPAAFAYWVRVHWVGAWQVWGEDESPPSVTPDGRGDLP